MNELNVVIAEKPEGVQLPPIVWNKDEVTAFVADTLASYKGRVYAGTYMRDAKADRAKLNKLDKQLGEVCTAAKKKYMEPVDALVADVKPLREQIKEASSAIDAQVKAEEAAKKAEKQDKLRQVYDASIGAELAELIPFEKLLNVKWLNATVTLTTATQELLNAIETCRSELDLLRKTCGEDFADVERVYIENLSIRDAMAKHQRLQEAREAQQRAEEARKAEEAARAAAPVVVCPSEEELAAQEVGRERAVTNAMITDEGRLDFSGLQTFAEPERKRYRFWVEFTAEDIAWFKDAAKSRGFKFGAIK